MKTVKVVAAVICDSLREKQSIFATARGYGEFKGQWEFPGGKVESGESAEQALLRELREELDVNIRICDLIETVEYDYPAFHLSMDCFWCELLGGAPKLLEAEDGRWLTKAELYTVPWLPADISLIRNIESKMGEPDLLRMQALRLLRHLCEEHILPETVFHAPVPETQNFSALVSRLRLALGERYPSTKLKRIMKSVHYANGFSDTDLREAAFTLDEAEQYLVRNGFLDHDRGVVYFNERITASDFSVTAQSLLGVMIESLLLAKAGKS